MNTARRIGTVLIGSIVAQIINLATLTYAALAFGPQVFGIYAIVFAIAAPIGLVATLRLETTIIFAQIDREVHLILTAAVVTTLTVALMIFVSAAVFQSLKIFYVGLLAALLGLNAININLSNFRQEFVSLAVVRVGIALGVLFGVFVVQLTNAPLLDYLIIATIVGQATGVVFGIILHKNWEAASRVPLSLADYRKVVATYKSFTIFNGAQSLFSTLQESAVVLVITAYGGVAVVGQYSFAQRVLRGPVTLVSEALGRVLQVNIRKASTSSDPDMRRAHIDILILRLCLGALLLAIILIFGVPHAVPLLGKQWFYLQDLVPAMAIYMSCLFVATTVAVFPLALGRPKDAAIYGIMGSLLYVATVTASLASGSTIVTAFWFVSAILPFYFFLFVKRIRAIVID